MNEYRILELLRIIDHKLDKVLRKLAIDFSAEDRQVLGLAHDVKEAEGRLPHDNKQTNQGETHASN